MTVVKRETPVWFRVTEAWYAAPVDEFERSVGPSRLELHVDEYPVLKETPKGVWLSLGLGDSRFVRHSARKQFASPTKELAFESFVARKRRQVSILSARLNGAEQALKLGLREMTRTAESAIPLFNE